MSSSYYYCTIISFSPQGQSDICRLVYYPPCWDLQMKPRTDISNPPSLSLTPWLLVAIAGWMAQCDCRFGTCWKCNRGDSDGAGTGFLVNRFHDDPKGP